jgi:uncharacterized Zn ribbon protein
LNNGFTRLRDNLATVVVMARYYFDIVDGAQIVCDDEGSEFDSSDAAVRAAARSAADIGTNQLAGGDTSDVVIEVSVL